MAEVKLESTVSVADMLKCARAFARAFRDLDARIQEANWRTELIET